MVALLSELSIKSNVSPKSSAAIQMSSSEWITKYAVQTNGREQVNYSVSQDDQSNQDVDELAKSFSAKNRIIDDTPMSYEQQHEALATAWDYRFSPEQSNSAAETIKRIVSEYYTRKTQVINTIPRKNINIAIQVCNSRTGGFWVDNEQTEKDGLRSKNLPERMSFIYEHYPRSEIVGYIIAWTLRIWESLMFHATTIESHTTYPKFNAPKSRRLLRELTLPRLYRMAIQEKLPDFFVDFLVDSMCGVYHYLLDPSDKNGVQSLHKRMVDFYNICATAVHLADQRQELSGIWQGGEVFHETSEELDALIDYLIGWTQGFCGSQEESDSPNENPVEEYEESKAPRGKTRIRSELSDTASSEQHRIKPPPLRKANSRR